MNARIDVRASLRRRLPITLLLAALWFVALALSSPPERASHAGGRAPDASAGP